MRLGCIPLDSTAAGSSFVAEGVYVHSFALNLWTTQYYESSLSVMSLQSAQRKHLGDLTLTPGVENHADAR